MLVCSRPAALLASAFLLSASALCAQTAQKPPVKKNSAAAAHRRVTSRAQVACPAPLPPPAVPVGLPPAPGPVQVKETFALRFVDTEVGTGSEAVPGKMVSLHYTGWLASDGTKFDSSYDHPDKQPIQLPLGGGRVIPGWDQGIVGMKQGGKRRLFIPYPLAYGTSGRPPRIPAKSDLNFDVELVDVSDAPAAQTGFAPRYQPLPRTSAAAAPSTPPTPPTPAATPEHPARP